jgi:hypothetical protein
MWISIYFEKKYCPEIRPEIIKQTKHTLFYSLRLLILIKRED